MIVCKFGGTSLADAGQIKKCIDIVRANPARCFVVPSAPGKRFGEDVKMTDLLYACYEKAQSGEDFSNTFHKIEQRFDQIINQLGLEISLRTAYDEIAARIKEKPDADYIASRGEYLSGRIIAAALGWPVVDAAEVVRFTADGRFDAETTQDLCQEKLTMPCAVVTAFYGARPDGSIQTFSRGGADISGAIVARGVGAEVYENWTDVSGFMIADPRIVENPAGIAAITYRELRELSYMGATVLHEDAIFPVRQAGIPIHVCNTNDPDAEGTWIRPALPAGGAARAVTGIAGRKGYTVITLEKEMMNNEIGFGRRALSVVEEQGIPYEHMPTGIDMLSLVIAGQHLKNGVLERITAALQTVCQPDTIEVNENLALIATVGEGMGNTVGISGRLFSAVAAAGINVRMIAQGSSELNIIIGVSDDDFVGAIHALYHAFV